MARIAGSSLLQPSRVMVASAARWRGLGLLLVALCFGCSTILGMDEPRDFDPSSDGTEGANGPVGTTLHGDGEGAGAAHALATTPPAMCGGQASIVAPATSASGGVLATGGAAAGGTSAGGAPGAAGSAVRRDNEGVVVTWSVRP